MTTPTSLPIPAWLAGSTIALAVAAAVRVAAAAGATGVFELMQLLILVALCVFGLLFAERCQADFADIYVPGPQVRRLVFLALFVALDCYLASIFMRGAVPVGGAGI